MRPTLKGRAKQVVIAWNKFLDDPANKLPYVAEAIHNLDAYISQVEREETEKSQPKLF